MEKEIKKVIVTPSRMVRSRLPRRHQEDFIELSERLGINNESALIRKIIRDRAQQERAKDRPAA